ncbi:MAG: hypothetical protein ACLR0U_20435 [Enterocloster clostridioformis]
MIEKLNIVCRGPDQKVRELSGGNQQKVCVGRALTFRPDLLYIGEPTRGIDIYSKELILKWILEDKPGVQHHRGGGLRGTGGTGPYL